MQAVPFDAGAMRECYRMICTEPFGEADHKFHALNWAKAPNYVAKHYKPVRQSHLLTAGPLRKACEMIDGTHARAGIGAAGEVSGAAFHVGQLVEARYQGSDAWYEAVVRSVSTEGAEEK